MEPAPETPPLTAPADDVPASPDVPVVPPDTPPTGPLVATAPGWALALLCAWLVAVPALAFLVSAEAATWAAAAGLALVAALRVMTPAGGLFVARTRMADVFVLLILAAALSALAPWALTADIGA